MMGRRIRALLDPRLLMVLLAFGVLVASHALGDPQTAKGSARRVASDELRLNQAHANAPGASNAIAASGARARLLVSFQRGMPVDEALAAVARHAPSSTPTAVTYVLTDEANTDHKVMVFIYPGDAAANKAEVFFKMKVAEARQQALDLLACERLGAGGQPPSGRSESEANECPAVGDARTVAALTAQSRIAATGADVRGVEVEAQGSEAAKLLASAGRDNVLAVEVIESDIRLTPILKSDAGGTVR